jgi:F0F1-type ATP synthase assembly protein I
MNESDLAGLVRRVTKYSGLIFRFSLGIIGGFFGGRYLDGQWGTSPFLLLSGVLLGLFCGLFILYREAMKEMRKE